MGELLLLTGDCPHCKNTLHWPVSEASIQCRRCNRYRAKTSTVPPQPYNDVLCRELEKLVFQANKGQSLRNTTWSGPEEKASFISLVISPLLTYWGMDQHKVPHKLTTLGNPMEVLDCSKTLGKRAARLTAEDANKIRAVYKCDYSDRLLQRINGESQVAIQVPVKGGGHGLFLAVSLALVGKELFWHALQLNVFKELREKKEQYNSLLKEQQLLKDWDQIVRQCDPNYIDEADGQREIRKVYLLALANVLKRPLILLDAQNQQTMSGVFLPVFHPAKECTKGGLCLVWADKDRTHVEPLIGIKDGNPIAVPADLIPHVWAANQTRITDYCDLKSCGGLLIKGKPLSESYVRDLTEAMLKVFMTENGISVNLLTDVYRCVYMTAGLLNIPLATMLQTTYQALRDERLYRCLDCRNISIMPEALLPGGQLYSHALNISDQLVAQKKYVFIALGYQCRYDEAMDRLVAIKKVCRVLECPWCEKRRIRQVNYDGQPILLNGDVTRTGGHWWNGEEYSAEPKVIPIALEWDGQVYPDTIHWFQNQEDASQNSTVDGIIDHLMQIHFSEETAPQIRRHVTRIVKLRLSQQHDLDIPGIEKSKQTRAEPTSIPAPDETMLCETVTAEGTGTHQNGIDESQVRWGKGEDDRHSPSGDSLCVDSAEATQLIPPLPTTTPTERGAVPKQKKVLHKGEMNGIDEPQIRGEEQNYQRQSSSSDSDSLYAASAEPTQLNPLLSTTIPKERGAVPKQKKVKVLHKGCEEFIDLPHMLTFDTLQQILERKFGVPVHRQRIQHGYPLTLLTISVEHRHKLCTKIQNNDRLVLTDKASVGLKLGDTSTSHPTNPGSQGPSMSRRRRTASNARPKPSAHGKEPHSPVGQTSSTHQSDSPATDALHKLTRVWKDVSESSHLLTGSEVLLNALDVHQSVGIISSELCRNMFAE